MSQAIELTNLPRVIEEFGAVFRNKGLNPPPLSPETTLDGSLGLESLDFAELVVRLRASLRQRPFLERQHPRSSYARRSLHSIEIK